MKLFHNNEYLRKYPKMAILKISPCYNKGIGSYQHCESNALRSDTPYYSCGTLVASGGTKFDISTDL